MPSTTQRILVNASWLIKLRWVASIGQMITIVVVRFLFQVNVTIWPVLVVIGLTVVSNACVARWFARMPNSPDQTGPNRAMNVVLGIVMTMDMLSLTALLYVSSGPNNPFVLFFFVNLCLCAVVLQRNWAWALNFLSVICFFWLLYAHIELDELSLGVWTQPIQETGEASIYQCGLAIAFTTCSSVIVYFLTRLTRELRKQEDDMRKVQLRQAQSEKLEALGTLAAGAAHELATPMSTIAVVAADAEKMIMQLPRSDSHTEDLVEDVRLIGSELKRCRKILDRMAFDAGQAVGERIQKVPLAQLWFEIENGLADKSRLRCELPEDVANTQVELPLDGLAQAIRGIVQNALDVDPESTQIKVQVNFESARHIWIIRDHGPGMSPATIKRIAEPFFTTKPPGKGTGLGVYLAQNFVERLGGTIRFQSSQRASTGSMCGTTVTISLPLTIKSQETTDQS